MSGPTLRIGQLQTKVRPHRWPSHATVPRQPLMPQISGCHYFPPSHARPSHSHSHNHRFRLAPWRATHNICEIPPSTVRYLPSDISRQSRPANSLRLIPSRCPPQPPRPLARPPARSQPPPTRLPSGTQLRMRLSTRRCVLKEDDLQARRVNCDGCGWRNMMSEVVRPGGYTGRTIWQHKQRASYFEIRNQRG